MNKTAKIRDFFSELFENKKLMLGLAKNDFKSKYADVYKRQILMHILIFNVMRENILLSLVRQINGEIQDNCLLAPILC